VQNFGSSPLWSFPLFYPATRRCDKHLCQVSNNFYAPNWVPFSMARSWLAGGGCGVDFGGAGGCGGGAAMSMADWMTRRLSACRQIFLMIFCWAGKGFISLRFGSIWGPSVLLCVWVSFYAPVSAKLIILRTLKDGERCLTCEGQSFLGSPFSIKNNLVALRRGKMGGSIDSPK